jgi:hypothetical protein
MPPRGDLLRIILSCRALIGINRVFAARIRRLRRLTVPGGKFPQKFFEQARSFCSHNRQQALAWRSFGSSRPSSGFQ